MSLIDLREIDNPRYVFKRLAEESGAEAFFPRSDEELKLVVEYTLAYYPPNLSSHDAYRRIEVNVRGRGLKIRARKGYRLSWR